MSRRIRVLQRLGGSEEPELRWTGQVRLQQKMIIGREGQIAVGTNPADPRVSRHAVTVTATERGWKILPTNRNGITVYPWAQPSLNLSTLETILWPRVGLRIAGSPDVQHWVLLEDDEAYTKAAARHTTGLTEAARATLPLTPLLNETVRVVFADLLAWPPMPQPHVMLLKSAARLLQISESALQDRLIRVRTRAYELGMSRQDVELTDPDYIYALAQAGYLER